MHAFGFVMLLAINFTNFFNRFPCFVTLAAEERSANCNSLLTAVTHINLDVTDRYATLICGPSNKELLFMRFTLRITTQGGPVCRKRRKSTEALPVISQAP